MAIYEYLNRQYFILQSCDEGAALTINQSGPQYPKGARNEGRIQELEPKLNRPPSSIHGP